MHQLAGQVHLPSFCWKKSLVSNLIPCVQSGRGCHALMYDWKSFTTIFDSADSTCTKHIHRPLESALLRSAVHTYILRNRHANHSSPHPIPYFPPTTRHKEQTQSPQAHIRPVVSCNQTVPGNALRRHVSTCRFQYIGIPLKYRKTTKRHQPHFVCRRAPSPTHQAPSHQ
jgi:hypothetical protein